MKRKQGDRFLVEAASLLASPLEYEETLAAVAQLAVRSLADFCVIDVIEDGEIRRRQVAHADPAQTALTEELLNYPLDRRRPHLSLTVLETGTAMLVPEVTSELLDSVSQGPEHRRILDALAPRSVMAAPLLARGQTVGVLLFVSLTRSYDAADLALAEQLGRLAGLEVDNAHHYRQAREAILARDRVLGIVAHDLRNPLNTIIMAADLINEFPLSDGQRRHQLTMILRSATRMSRLIQDLLDVARLERDGLPLRKEQQRPDQLAAEAVELSLPLAAARSVQLGLQLCDSTATIVADRDRMLQVLANLIDNAIKFTPAGGCIEVRVDHVAGDILFTVADTGTGIAPEHLSHLFQPFWQARTTSLEGTGLGLTIARGIVEAHGGRIWAESVPGQGSAFHFTVSVAADVLEAHGAAVALLDTANEDAESRHTIVTSGTGGGCRAHRP